MILENIINFLSWLSDSKLVTSILCPAIVSLSVSHLLDKRRQTSMNTGSYQSILNYAITVIDFDLKRSQQTLESYPDLQFLPNPIAENNFRINASDIPNTFNHYPYLMNVIVKYQLHREELMKHAVANKNLVNRALLVTFEKYAKSTLIGLVKMQQKPTKSLLESGVCFSLTADISKKEYL